MSGAEHDDAAPEGGRVPGRHTAAGPEDPVPDRPVLDGTATAKEDVGGRTAAGVVWMTAQKWTIRILGLVTIAVLTRLLSPEDFGTVAAASTVLPFFYLLADLGFVTYLVQVDRVDRRMLSTAFWFCAGAGVLLCAALYFLAPVFGMAFRDDNVVLVLRALSLWVLFTAAGSVPMALLRRNMRFSTLAWQGALAAALAQIVAMVLAFSGAGVWALVAQSLVAPVISTLLAWSCVQWWPGLQFSFSEFRIMASFGTQVLGVEFVAMLRASGEAAVVSATLGVAALGFYSVAQRLVQVVQDLTGSAIVPVTQIAFAKIRDAHEQLRHAYLRALRIVYFALSLPLTFLAVTAPVVVPLVFGQGWEVSFQPARILALAGMLTVGAWLDHALFYGLGRPGTWFAYAVVVDGVTLGATLVLARYGLVAIAWGFVAVCVAATAARWFLVAKVIGARPRVVAGPFGFLLLVAAASWGTGALVSWGTAGLPNLLALALIGLSMLAVHLGVTRLVAPSVLAELARMLTSSRIVHRLLRRGPSAQAPEAVS